MPRQGKSDAPVAVVTGGARGIGLAVAERFLAAGHRVALLDRDSKALLATGKRLGTSHRVLTLVCDVSDPKQVNQPDKPPKKGLLRRILGVFK